MAGRLAERAEMRYWKVSPASSACWNHRDRAKPPSESTGRFMTPRLESSAVCTNNQSINRMHPVVCRLPVRIDRLMGRGDDACQRWHSALPKLMADAASAWILHAERLASA